MSWDIFFIGFVYMSVFLFANKIIPTNKIRRKQWMSFSGGLAVSYVFVYLLPTLHDQQAMIHEEYGRLAMQSELYFVGLIGLILFFSIQKYADHVHKSAPSHDTDKENKENNDALFWLEVVFFSFYSLLVAYTVVSSNVSGVQAIFYSSAIGLHFMAVAYDLWRVNPSKYLSVGRHILASSVIIGWIFGMLVPLSLLLESIIFAFISGAMILNVLNNELPRYREAHYISFCIGIILYTSITMALKFYFEW